VFSRSRLSQLFMFCLLLVSALIYPVRNYIDLNVLADANERLGNSEQPAISAADNHNCAVTSIGGVQCWGENNYGQLGDGTTTQRTAPVGVSGLSSGVEAVATGGNHSCALLTDGGVKCWGFNGKGQLGNGNFTNQSSPVDVVGLSANVTALTAGQSHSCALVSGGTVQCWGWNGNGQLGTGTTSDSLTPADVNGLPPSGESVVAITADIYHTCALVSNGSAHCWGRNIYGILGDGTTTQRTSPVAVSGLSTGVTSISAGYFHTCAVISGEVKCWGLNEYGYVGDGSTTQRLTPVSVSNLPPAGKTITAVSAGFQHSCALISDGTVQCWGRGDFGQNGDGSTITRTTPVAVSGLSGVSAITVGQRHSCALLSVGSARCWGNNGSRQLGNGDTTNSSTPVRVFGFYRNDNSAPTALVAVPSVGDKGPKFDLTWTEPLDISGLTKYTIEYSTDAGSTWTTFPRSARNVNSFSVFPVSYEVDYQFRVTAVFGAGSGTASASSTAAKVEIAACSPEISTNGFTSVFPVGVCKYTVPSGVTSLTLDLRGAAGGGGDGNFGKSAPARGASLQGRLSVTPGETLYLYVGDEGTKWTSSSDPLGGRGGFNGGGFGGEGTSYFSGGGGGATDIRTSINNLSTRLVVAGAAGGGAMYGNSCCSFAGGGGGTTSGEQQTSSDGSGGSGGTQSAGGSGGVNGRLGNGADGLNFIVSTDGPGPGGGGAGYYGGGSGYRSGGGWISGGGGGSSFTSHARYTSTTATASQNCAPGFLAITIGTDRSQVPAAPSSCSSQDTTRPSLVSAAVNSAGTTVTLTYSEALSATTASASAFAVTVGGVSRSVSTAARSGSTIVLTLAAPSVETGQSVTVAYSDPSTRNDSYAVQDSAGNDAATLAATAVTNNSTVDVAAPSLVSAAVNSAGTTVTLTYSEALSATTAGASDFAVTVGGVSRSVSSVAVSGSTVVLTLSSAVGAGQSVSVAYSQPAGSNAVKDSAGNKAVSLAATSVTNNSTVDQTAPTLVSASTDVAGRTITLTYSETLGGMMAPRGAFAVRVGGVSCSIDGASYSGSAVSLGLACSIASGQEVTVAYTDPTGGNDSSAVQDSAGNDAATLAATSVTNNADSVGPTFSSATTNAAGTEVTLTFGEVLSATTAAASAFSVVVNGTPVTPSSVTISGSSVVLAVSPAIQVGDTVSFTYTDPTAGNDSNAVQDAIGNDVASISSTPVTNASSVDTRDPSFVSATTNSAGTTVTLTYSEALSATTAGASDFAVTVGGVSRSVSSVAVSGSTVVLTLSSAVGAGQSVSVAYTDPTGGNDTNALQDAAGNDAATLAATSVTNSVPAPSSSGSPDPGTTTTTTTSTTVAPTATTTTTVAPTTATVRSVTTVPRRTTTTTAVNRTTTTTIRATTTTAFRPLEPLAPIVSTTTSVLSPTTSTAKASVTSVAISSIESLQQAEGRLKAVEAQTSTANNDLRIAQIKLGESIVAVLDPKSALTVAVNVAEEKVVSLSAASASAEQIAAAVAQLENLKIAISQNVSLSIERIAEAQSRLAAVLANPAATAQQVAAAKAELVSARVPDVGVVAEILTVANSDSHLQPVIIPGVVDNPGTGQFVLLDGATAKSVEITRINGTSLRMTSTDGFRLVISTRDKNGDPVQFNSRGGIVVKHGNLISIAGEGFAPGTTAKTWLFSSPRELGNLNVSPNGSFAADFPITDDIRVGNHTAQVNGLSPDGEVRSLSLDVEILPNEGPAPYDPLANRLAVAALIAQAMALLALSRRKDNDGDDRDQADVSEVSVDHVVGSDGNKRDVYSPPVLQSLDKFLQRIPSRLATTQQLLARIVHDAVYLRALTGVGGAVFAFTGVVVGFFAAQSANFAGQSPSFVWIAALVVLGSLDALSGGLAALTIVITTGIAGGLNSTDSIRGLLGLTVMCFAIPLVASTTRPFRRAASDSVDRLWKRASDLVLIAVFGAWAAGAMYDALPGLYGFTSSAAGRTTTIQLLVFGTLVLRFGLESLATRVTGQRLTYLVGATLPDSTQGRTVLSILVRTIIMVFVAETFIGNNIALWIGAGMYAIPKLIATRAEHFPKSALLNTWLPSGLLRTVVMLFVARWWASNISAFSEDPSTQLQAAFVLLGIPSLVLTSLGWFAGGGHKWHSTPVSKVLGIVVLAIGVLTVRSVLFT
jgi:uncharacterized repeat protein (TIGR02059 family)